MKHSWHSLLCLATPVFCQYAGDEYGRGAPSGQETASFGWDNQQVQGGYPDRSYGTAPGYPNSAGTAAQKKALAQVLGSVLADAAEEQAKKKEMEDEMAEKINRYCLIIFAIGHPIFSIIGALVFLSLPKNQQPEPMPQAQRDYFAYGLCDGCGHPDVRICWCSICCPTVRWAANASSPKVNFLGLGFWALLLQMEVLICLPLIFTIFGLRNFGIFSLSVLGMFVRNRHKIRQVYGLPTWTCGSCMEDICCSMFCASIGLTIMQEALQLEYVGEPVALGEKVHGDRAGGPLRYSDGRGASPPFPDGRRMEEGKPPEPSIRMCCAAASESESEGADWPKQESGGAVGSPCSFIFLSFPQGKALRGCCKDQRSLHIIPSCELLYRQVIPGVRCKPFFDVDQLSEASKSTALKTVWRCLKPQNVTVDFPHAQGAATLRSIAIDNLPFRYQLSEAMQNWILLVSSKGHVDGIFWQLISIHFLIHRYF